MTPLFPLRLLLTGILSWALLLGGGYCFWELSQRFLRSDVGAIETSNSALDSPTDPLLESDRPIIPADPVRVVDTTRPLRDWPTWAILTLGLSMTGWSFGGYGTLRLLAGGRKEGDLESLGTSGELLNRPDGSRLHIQVFGNRAGPTLIFTHGWSLDRSDWFYARHELASRFTIVLWDLPGLGQSIGASSHDQSIEKMAHDLDAVVSHVATDQPIVLVGHSIGGMIVQTYARLYPERLAAPVQAIVLVNTTCRNPLTTMLLSPVWTALQWPLIIPLQYVTIGLAPLVWITNWKSYLDGSLLLFSRLTSFAGRQTWGQLDHASRLSAKAWPAVLARGNLAMFRFNEETTLPNISIPVLVLAGNHDRVTQPRASQRIADLIPESKLEILPGGHLQLLELHQQVNERIGSFLELQLAARSVQNPGTSKLSLM